MVNRIGTARADLLEGTPRDDYFEPRNNVQRPPGIVETDTVIGGEGFDSMAVQATSSCSFIGSAGTGSWSIGSSDGDTSVIATGIEEVAFSGSSQDDTFNTGNATGTIVGGGFGDVDIWIADFSGRSGAVRFGLTSAFDITVHGMTVQQVERMNLTTGAGRDVLSGGQEGDTIISGAGDDRIDPGSRRANGTTGNDDVDGGLGQDTLVVHAEADLSGVQVGTVTGGFFVRSGSARFLCNAANTEKIEIFTGGGNDVIDTGAGGASIIQASRGSQVDVDHWLADLSAATSAITYAMTGPAFRRDDLGIVSVSGIERITLTLGAFDDTLTGGAQGDTVNGGAGDDIVDLKTRDATGATGSDVFNAGGGTDTLVVDAGAETLGVSLGVLAGGFFARSGSARFSVDAFDCEKVRFTGGAGDDVIDSGRGGERISGGGGLDFWIADYGATSRDIRFEIPSQGGSASLTALGLLSISGIERIRLTTGRGDDTITGGAQGDTVTGGAGDDVVDLKTRAPTGATGSDLFEGGRGTDTLIVDAHSDRFGVSLGVIDGGFFVRSASARYVVDATDCEKVRFTGGSGDDVIDSGRGGERIAGGAGLDFWIADYGTSAKDLVFSIAEQTGGKVSATLATVGLTQISGVERIRLTTGRGDDTITGGAEGDTVTGGAGDDVVDLKTRDATGATGADLFEGGAGNDTLVVDASAETASVSLGVFGGGLFVRSASGRFQIDATDCENVRFDGGRGADGIVAGAGRDDLTGGAGADTLNGGAGRDTLDGGAGKDVFRFDQLGKANADVILTFTARDDVIELDDAVFTGLATGPLARGQFQIGPADDADDRILLQNGRFLYYDADGNGRQQAVLFAQIDTGAALAARDFVVI